MTYYRQATALNTEQTDQESGTSFHRYYWHGLAMRQMERFGRAVSILCSSAKASDAVRGHDESLMSEYILCSSA